MAYTLSARTLKIVKTLRPHSTPAHVPQMCDGSGLEKHASNACLAGKMHGIYKQAVVLGGSADMARSLPGKRSFAPIGDTALGGLPRGSPPTSLYILFKQAFLTTASEFLMQQPD